MQYRTDPRSGNRLSALGLGCMRFPGYLRGRPDPAAAARIIATAVDAGVNYLDTAYVYRGSEQVTGEALERSGLRERVFLATKLPHGKVRAPQDLGRLFGEQLSRLRTDHVDYYLVHNLTSAAQFERLRGLGFEEWAARERRSERLRELGFSFHGASGDFAALLGAYDWDFCQIQYNYMNETYQAGTAGLAAAAARGLAVVVMEPLLGGKLADGMPRAAARELRRADPARDPASWGLRWVWDHPEVTVALSGMTSPEQVTTNALVAADALPGCLSAEERAAIGRARDVLERLDKVSCTGCGYCMPCPRGVNIPGTFAAYNASYAFGRMTGVQQYMTASSAASDHPRLASSCVSCGACVRRCPQHIDIPAELARARRRLEPAPVALALRLMRGRARRGKVKRDE